MKKPFIIKTVIAVILVTAAVMFISGLARGFSEPVVSMEGDELTVESVYGVTVAKSEITSVRLLDEMPALTRGDGFGVGNTQKGKIIISNLGPGLAYVKVNRPPYIYIELASLDNYVFINLNDANDTQRLYENIQAWLQT